MMSDRNAAQEAARSPFQPGDKVRVLGTVETTDPGSGWITVKFTGYNVLVNEHDTELVDRAKTPGQVAYDAFWEDPENDYTAPHFTWTHLSPSVRAQWERVARAAKEE